MANRYFLNIGANWGDTANWSDTSGGTGGFSVPTNVDDVFFDANSGNCTVNASARTAKTLNFTGYTNTITMSNTITVSGNVTLGAGMGIAGANALIVNETSTLTSNGKTWSAPFTFSGTSKTFTLGDNWTISGQVNLSGTTATTINSNTLTSSGNLTSTTSATTTGTTNISLTGGTWSNSSTGALRNNLTFTSGTITISGTVYYNTRTLTYTSGTVTTTGSTLIIGDFANTTLNTGSLSWNNLTIANQLTITLQSDLNIGGLLTVNAGNHLHTFNGTFNINCSGGLTINSTGLVQGTGTTTLNILGGTWTGGQIRLNTNINGNVTLTNINYSTGTLTYVSGNITLVGTATVAGTLNVAGIFWNNLTTGNNTLLSDLNVRGLLTGTGNITFSGAYNVNLYGGITHPGYLQCFGTPKPIINLYGGIFTSNQIIDTTINLLGNVTWQSVGLDLNSTINYISGIISGTNTSLLSINQGGNTLLNFDKISILRIVNFTNNANVTMNRFFNGTASYPTQVQCSTTTGTYTVAFQDTFEKIANNVKVSGCIVQNRGQLIVNGRNSNKGLNTGVRFGNQSPNGLPKNTPAIKTETTFGIGNISDPTMVIS